MHLLVATDGSEPAQLAIWTSATLAAALHAETTVLTVSQVLDLVALTPLGTMQYSDAEKKSLKLEIPNRAEVAALQTEAGRTFDLLGVKPSYHHDFGNPADVILDVAKSLAVDLIVIGTRGQTGIGRFLMGSVAEKVTRYATCSVLVARGHPWPLPSAAA